MKKTAKTYYLDIDKDTIDWQNNFDDSLREPSVLPSRLPNLLLNGGTGIAVGITNMLHNLSEVVDGTISYIENKGNVEVSDLIQHIKAPDFPTGGTIYGYDGVKSALKLVEEELLLEVRLDLRAGQKENIIVEEIPYMVNKSDMIKKTADLVNKKIEGISDIRDESDRNGMRDCIRVKKRSYLILC